MASEPSTVSSALGRDDVIQEALRETRGARFYRCALQVNPYDYVKNHANVNKWASEDEYNVALVSALLDAGVEVIGITDHYKVETAQGLLAAAEAAGIHVFPGFEASTSMGVHFLCLFDQDTPIKTIRDYIASCGVTGEVGDGMSPQGTIDTEILVAKSQNEWGAACVAAHVTQGSGILTVYKGGPRIRHWTNQDLKAACIPGSKEDLPNQYKVIVDGTDVNYRRKRKIALINACDISDPEDVSRPGATTRIKMSKPSVEGLRQAFLDPDSRILLNSVSEPEEHSGFVAMGWEGGFLDGVRIHFNESLNVLVGGRGSGKSTIVESLRYVLGLDAIGEDAQRAHDSAVKHVLRSGTKVTLLVRRYLPARRDYLITRTVPNPPLVRDENGNVLNMSPSDVIPGVEIYGQHEISELAKDRAKLTRLLERFVAPRTSVQQQRRAVEQGLTQSRKRLVELRREEEEIQDRLRELPAIQETLKQYEAAGLEARLGEQSRLMREERVIEIAQERVADVKEGLDALRGILPLDRAFLSENALGDLPNRTLLLPLDAALVHLEEAVSLAIQGADAKVKAVEADAAEVHRRWSTERDRARDTYERALRDLQKDRIDGEEFIRLRRQIEHLRPLNERLTVIQRERQQAEQRRRNLLAEWEDAKRETFSALQAAAKKVTKRLGGRVDVHVEHQGDRAALRDLLDGVMTGKRKPVIDALDQLADLSLQRLADACRAGVRELKETFPLTTAQAQRLAELDEETCLRIEELDLPPTTRLRLNISAEGQSPEWRTLVELSTGQRATAVLLLLLLESKAPLVVDQPEDDLDNRFIFDDVVPAIRREKGSRQFVFATHNANIPVLGDADLILGLVSESDRGLIPDDYRGAIDKPTVAHLVGEILEGGKAAFEWRRDKYGF